MLNIHMVPANAVIRDVIVGDSPMAIVPTADFTTRPLSRYVSSILREADRHSHASFALISRRDGRPNRVVETFLQFIDTP